MAKSMIAVLSILLLLLPSAAAGQKHGAECSVGEKSAASSEKCHAPGDIDEISVLQTSATVAKKVKARHDLHAHNTTLSCPAGEKPCAGSETMQGYCTTSDFCSPNCNYTTQVYCSGKWDYGTAANNWMYKQLSADTCEPMSTGCPCHEGEKKCPSYNYTYDGITTTYPGYCLDEDSFCPVYCDYDKETYCSGEYQKVSPWKQLSANTCANKTVGCPCFTGQKKCPPYKTTWNNKTETWPGYCVDDDQFCPVYCDYSTEMYCSGEYNYTTYKQLSADTCMPKSDEGCPCHVGQKKCPSYNYTWDGTTTTYPGYCIQDSYFCPVHCDYDTEVYCSGEWNGTTQLSANTCAPRETGCPCDEDETKCPSYSYTYDGKTETWPGWCISQDEFCPAFCDYDTEVYCCGKWTTESPWKQLSPDYCANMTTGCSSSKSSMSLTDTHRQSQRQAEVRAQAQARAQSHKQAQAKAQAQAQAQAHAQAHAQAQAQAQAHAQARRHSHR